MKPLIEIQTELTRLYYIAVDLAYRLYHAEEDIVELHPDKFNIYETNLSDAAMLIADAEHLIDEMKSKLNKLN